MRGRPIGQSSICLISICCCLLVALPAVSYSLNDLERLELHGSVRTVVTKYPQLKTTHQFDREGHLISLDLQPTNEADSARYIYQYDQSGHLTEEDTFEPDNTVAYRKLFRYGIDERGRLSAQVAVTENGQFAHAAFFMYDHRGLLTEEIMVSGQGVVEKSLYDVKGNLVYDARYFQGRLVLEASHHYDPLDRIKESRFYGGDGQLMRKDHYKYDQAGNRMEQTSDYYRHSHLRKSVNTYEFDHAGNWIKETTQRWSGKFGLTALTETVVSRERTIAYY